MKISFFLYYRSQFAAAALVKGYFSVGKREKRVIAAAADIDARMDLGSTLTGYNRSGPDN
jgi:hypothetical protein